MAKPKTTTKHPYAATDHRVIDSPAYADLSHSACRLMTILTRQLSKDNNGNLQATFAYCQPRGIGSEHTLRDAIADLIAHGFIYRTRSHGANKAWARYAVTWLPIPKRDGLFLAGFTPCAWRDWQPGDKKSRGQKVQDQSGRKCSFISEKPAESAGNLPAESADYELVPIEGGLSTHTAGDDSTDDASLHAEYCRDEDIGQAAQDWDEDQGEFVRRPSTKKPRSSKVERVRAQIEAMQC